MMRIIGCYSVVFTSSGKEVFSEGLTEIGLDWGKVRKLWHGPVTGCRSSEVSGESVCVEYKVR